MNLLIVAGVFQLFFASLTGWLMFIISDYPERAKKMGILKARRIRQWHLELLMQGSLVTALGAALDSPPLWACVVLVAAAWVAPFSFFPLAFKPDLAERPWYLAIDVLSFVGFNVSLFALFIAAVVQR